MKTIFRFLGLSVLVAGFAAGGASVFAQDPAASPAPAATPSDPCDTNRDARNALEEKVRTIYNAPKILDRQAAVDAGEEYIKTYGNDTCESAKAYIVYLNGYLPPTKKAIEAEKLRLEIAKVGGEWDVATKAGSWDQTYTSGKRLLELTPDNLNVIIAMGSIGLDETAKKPPVTKYNDETIKYAKLAIQKINEGKPSNKNVYGAYQFVYKNKENTLGWMNYTIGYVMYFGQNNKKEALPYLFKASQQAGADTQKLPQVYGILGDYYFDEVRRLGEDIRVKTVAAGNKDTEETKALIAQLKAYAERAIDAYGRAQNAVSPTDASQKAYREGLGKQVETLYKLRFQKTDGIAPFVSAQIAKPLPDPTTAPTPIVEEEVPAPTTTGTASASTTAPATTTPTTGKPATTAPATKPAATTPAAAKPATTPATTKKPVSTTGTETKGTTATTKKVVVKKKGTR